MSNVFRQCAGRAACDQRPSSLHTVRPSLNCISHFFFNGVLILVNKLHAPSYSRFQVLTQSLHIRLLFRYQRSHMDGIN